MITEHFQGERKMRDEVKKIWPEIEWIQDPELKQMIWKKYRSHY